VKKKKTRNIVKGVLKTLICIYGCFVLVLEKDRFLLAFIPISRSDVTRGFLDNKSDGNAASSVEVEVEKRWVIDPVYI